jgi:hypothetical protein
MSSLITGRASAGAGMSSASLSWSATGIRRAIWSRSLPPIDVVVIEHRCQRVRCPDCGSRPRGVLPAGAGASAFGPRFHAAIAVLSVRNRISRRFYAIMGIDDAQAHFGRRLVVAVSSGRPPTPRR